MFVFEIAFLLYYFVSSLLLSELVFGDMRHTMDDNQTMAALDRGHLEFLEHEGGRVKEVGLTK
jgi:hypothetical protein